jgi:hypothetical protein
LVDGVHKCPVQVEQECRLWHLDVRSRGGGHELSLRVEPRLGRSAPHSL